MSTSTGTVEVAGARVAYVCHGQGPRLLLLHGSGGTLATNALLRKPFAERFEVLSVDYRGMGLSSEVVEPFDMAALAADALAVADHLGWSSFALFGMSFGGMVAQELAVTAPERVTRLALACTSPGGAGGASFPLDQRPAEPLEYDTRFTPEWLATHRKDRALMDYVGSALRDPAQLEARRHHDVTGRLGAIGCPTLVAAGRHDGIAPLANSEAIVAAVANARLQVFEGGHLFLVQDRTAMGAVIEFLAAERRPAATSPRTRRRP